MSLYNLSNIDADARRTYFALRRAFSESRHRDLVTHGDKQRIREMEWRDLGYWNAGARRRWGKIVCEEIARQLTWDDERNRPGRSVFLLTVADNSGATSVNAPPIDLSSIKRKLVRGLKGLNFIAMMEPAFYVNLQQGVRFDQKRCVYWHLHALVWGVSYKRLKAVVGELNDGGDYRSIADGLKPVHVARIKQPTLPKVVGYLLKSPSNGYRISKCDRMSNGEIVTDDDGVILHWFWQSKAKLRMSERIQLFCATRHLTLDGLVVGGGEGTSISRRTKRRFNDLVRDSKRPGCRVKKLRR